MNPLIYDLEIRKAIPGRNAERLDGIKYCEGWHDHAGMGISVICAYDYADDRYRVFCEDNFHEFMGRATQPDTLLVSFNSIPFDNAVISAELGVPFQEEICYDILRETWAAAGLGPKFVNPSHAGYGLDAMCETNFGSRKSGNGALAPVLWQRGQIGEVIDYCLNDVRLTKQLLDRVLQGLPLVSPKDGQMLRLKKPW